MARNVISNFARIIGDQVKSGRPNISQLLSAGSLIGKVLGSDPITPPVGGRNFGAASAILDAGLRQAQAILAGVPKLKPFDFDKALAKATRLATSQANKFFTEKLENFMEGIEVERSQSKETELRLIDTLNAQSDRFLGKEKQEFEIAKDNALQGFAATSTQTSPLTRGKLGQEEAVFERGISDFLSGVEERRGGLLEGGRQFLERSIFGEKTGRTDIAREKKLDIQTGIAGGITTAIQRQGVKDRAQTQAFQTALGKANIINQSALSRAFGAL